MIKSVADKRTLSFLKGARVKEFEAFAEQANRRLRALDAAQVVEDLRIPPGNRLEALTGRRKGQYSIRINAQWRICFRFENGDAYDVEIVDYH
ncbi:MAG: type II toxin-antitoxin system RelE/ParE family toxin [Rhodospirillales bacterium]|nr:type II toxin-antitoxin system RelE/ParE family toxin [Rhodospirillales bacterium]